jgi:hypothetical protein
MDETANAVIGAGAHGLATALLRRAGEEVRVFGDPMSFWRTTPAGFSGQDVLVVGAARVRSSRRR